METTIKVSELPAQATKNRTRSKSRARAKKIEALLIEAEHARFGVSPSILTFVVCVSSIAGAYAITNSFWELAMVGFPTAIFITSIIAIAPMRTIFTLAAITLLIDIAVLIIR